LTVAGAQLPGISINDGISKVKAAIEEYLREGER
jgi:hypothetical protein